MAYKDNNVLTAKGEEVANTKEKLHPLTEWLWREAHAIQSEIWQDMGIGPETFCITVQQIDEGHLMEKGTVLYLCFWKGEAVNGAGASCDQIKIWQYISQRAESAEQFRESTRTHIREALAMFFQSKRNYWGGLKVHLESRP